MCEDVLKKKSIGINQDFIIPYSVVCFLCCCQARRMPTRLYVKKGYVWREAFVGDYVCVTPKERKQAAFDNKMAASRRQPVGGAYGKDTCFVWRETRKGDHVCVTPQTRKQSVLDNRMAASRIAKSVLSRDATAKLYAGGVMEMHDYPHPTE